MTTTSSESWTVARLTALSREEFLTLFKTLTAPAFAELDGEYRGYIPDGGDAAAREQIARTMFNERAPFGYWLGKAFTPTTPAAGEGYNCYRRPDGRVYRFLRFGTGREPSILDGRPSFVIRYARFNNVCGERDLVDEVRRLEDGLYLAISTTRAADGSRTPPGAFFLSGPVGSWLGVDDKTAEPHRP